LRPILTVVLSFINTAQPAALALKQSAVTQHCAFPHFSEAVRTLF